MNCLKIVLTVSVVSHPLMLLSVRPIVFKSGVGAVGAASLINAGLSYQKRTQSIEKAHSYNIDDKYRDRRLNTGAAIGLGVAVTALVAVKGHKHLPTSRLEQAAVLRKKAADFPLVRPYQSSEDFFKKIEEYHLLEYHPYMKAFDDLRAMDYGLMEARKLVAKAKKDFEQDGNQEGLQECVKVKVDVLSMEDYVDSLIAMIKNRRDFGERAERHARVKAARRQAQAAEETASNTSTIAAASVVSAINSFHHK